MSGFRATRGRVSPAGGVAAVCDGRKSSAVMFLAPRQAPPSLLNGLHRPEGVGVSEQSRRSPVRPMPDAPASMCVLVSTMSQPQTLSHLIQSKSLSLLQTKGATMSNLTGALQELREERSRAQSQVERLDQAISVIESLNGSGTSRNATQPKRIISAASRRKMALAQRARWARGRNGSQPAKAVTRSAPAKRTMSASARRKIAAAQRERWAKVKAGKKKAA